MNKIIPDWLIWAVAATAFIGFMDATYLTAVHYKGAELGCTSWGSCNAVTTSEYAVIFGIPTALLGAFYYLGILLLALIHIDTHKIFPLKLISLGTAFGFIFSIFLVYIQLFIIHEICIYCMFSAGTSTILFVLGILIILSRKRAGTGQLDT